ncbi:unnamed protein product [Brassicogethes aeneus]|uniref:SRR1-like domain-containing protein n=1 Tax=Brassicogethes aeneus TaxID=1431903 RepID=A0A9P0FEQ9_BRAAE|nr:unnamed protein product [Brassicogethes aeneus]
MSTSSNLNDDFKKVTYKRKCTGPLNKKTTNNAKFKASQTTIFNKEATIRRIDDAKSELITTDFFDSVLASLREGLTILSTNKISEIICLGLGRIGECLISRYQFALVLLLRDNLQAELSFFDPVFTNSEISLLKHYASNVLTQNLEGKYRANNKHILFYLPHCPKQLSNNLLWCNWGLDLNYCIILSNSFNQIIDNTSKRELEKSGQYISNITPYTVELAIVNNFKYFEIFNDLAIHIFPINKLNLITKDFWNVSLEPKYTDEDVEFIREKLTDITLS